MSSQRLVHKQEDSVARLRSLINSTESELRRVFLNAVRSSRSSLKISRISDLLEQGRIEEALLLISAIPEAISNASSTGFNNSATSTAAFVGVILSRPVFFNPTLERAVITLRTNRARLIRDFTSEQRLSTLAAITDGIRRGLNPRQQAQNFRNSIGLTSRQMQAVNNYRRLLEQGSLQALNRELRDRRFDSSVRSAIRNNRQLTPMQIDRMVSRYSERFIRYRSEVIARTEALRVVHQGVDEMYQQTFDSGLLQPEQLIRTWVTSRDARVRETHNGMNGQQRSVGEPFKSDSGNTLRYPGDENAPASETVQCRCVVTTRFII